MSLSRKCNLQAYEILKRAETIKEGCLEKMGLVTDADRIEDAVWFVNFRLKSEPVAECFSLAST